jgi:hypothetical protein
MIQRANEALREIGYVPTVDTSITTADSQTEYTLPVACKRENLLRVEIQSITTDANDNQWVTIVSPRVVAAGPGTTGLLIIPQYTTGYNVKLTYLGQHAAVSAYSDVISEYINPILAVKALEVQALNWLISRKGQSATDFDRQRLNKALVEYDAAKAQYPVLIEKHYPRYAVFGSSELGEAPVGTVRL